MATSETNVPSVEIPTTKAVAAKSRSEKGQKMAARARELKMRKRKAHRQRIRARNAKG